MVLATPWGMFWTLVGPTMNKVDGLDDRDKFVLSGWNAVMGLGAGEMRFVPRELALSLHWKPSRPDSLAAMRIRCCVVSNESTFIKYPAVMMIRSCEELGIAYSTRADDQRETTSTLIKHHVKGRDVSEDRDTAASLVLELLLVIQTGQCRLHILTPEYDASPLRPGGNGFDKEMQ
ncbi:hypothetical protein SNK03_007903 [Fusarium graminearum]